MAIIEGNQALILAYLFAHPGEETSLSQIGTVLNKRPGVFQKGLASLVREGVVSSRRNGIYRLLKLNEYYPMITEVRSIITKTVGVEGLLRDLLGSHATVDTAAIYGSYAADRMRANSDIDLLIVVAGTSLEDTVIDGIDAVERRISRQINYKAYTLSDYRTKRMKHDPFLDTIITGPIIVLKGHP